MQLNDFIGNEKAKQQLTDWLNKFYHSTKNTNPYAIIQGYTGNGKTTLVYALANSYNVYVHRITADDVFDAHSFNSFAKSLNLQHLKHLKTKKLILIDDLNEFPKHIRKKLYTIYKISNYPIIFTIDTLDSIKNDNNYNDFIRRAIIVKVEKPLSSKLHQLLQEKAKELGVAASYDVLLEIAQNSLSVRSAINSLYNLCTNDVLTPPQPNIFGERKLLLQRKVQNYIDVELIKRLSKNLNCYEKNGLLLMNLLSSFDVELKVKRKRYLNPIFLNLAPFPIDKVTWLQIKPNKQEQKETATDSLENKAKQPPIKPKTITDFF